jgi:hypothetical protein
MLSFDISMPKDLVPAPQLKRAPNSRPAGINQLLYSPYNMMVKEIERYLKTLKDAQSLVGKLNTKIANGTLTISSFNFTIAEMQTKWAELFGTAALTVEEINEIASLLVERAVFSKSNNDECYTPLVGAATGLVHDSILDKHINELDAYLIALKADNHQRFEPLAFLPLGWTASGNIQKEAEKSFNPDSLSKIENDRHYKQAIPKPVLELLIQLRRNIRQDNILKQIPDPSISNMWRISTYVGHFWEEYSLDVYLDKNDFEGAVYFLEMLNEACWQGGVVDKMFAWHAVYGNKDVVKHINTKFQDAYAVFDSTNDHDDHIHLDIRPLNLKLEIPF